MKASFLEKLIWRSPISLAVQFPSFFCSMKTSVPGDGVDGTHADSKSWPSSPLLTSMALWFRMSWTQFLCPSVFSNLWVRRVCLWNACKPRITAVDLEWCFPCLAVWNFEAQETTSLCVNHTPTPAPHQVSQYLSATNLGEWILLKPR